MFILRNVDFRSWYIFCHSQGNCACISWIKDIIGYLVSFWQGFQEGNRGIPILIFQIQESALEYGNRNFCWSSINLKDIPGMLRIVRLNHCK